MTPRLRTIFSMLIVAFAGLIAAWKGTLDYMGIAILAVVLHVPGTTWIRNMFTKRKCDGQDH